MRLDFTTIWNTYCKSTVLPLSSEDQVSEEVKEEHITLDRQRKSKYNKKDKDDINPIYDPMADIPNDDDHMNPEFEPIEESMPEADDWDHDAYDQYIAAEVILPVGGQFMLGKVVERKKDHHGQPIGQSHSNPILDTRIYQVEFPDGHIEEYSANTIAECYSQINNEGRQYLVINEIIDW